MTNREREIRLLNRLFYGADEMTKHQDFELNQAIKRVVADVARNASRAGKDSLRNLACYGCGVSGVPFDRCTCEFGESFRCGERLFCADCRKAREAVAAHLLKLFSLPIVNRVNSRRLTAWRELSRAIRACYPEDAEPHECRLYSEIAQVDEWDAEAFRRDLPRCFARSRFLDYQRLAKALREQQDESLIRSIIRSGLAR